MCLKKMNKQKNIENKNCFWDNKKQYRNNKNNIKKEITWIYFLLKLKNNKFKNNKIKNNKIKNNKIKII